MVRISGNFAREPDGFLHLFLLCLWSVFIGLFKGSLLNVWRGCARIRARVRTCEGLSQWDRKAERPHLGWQVNTV